DIECALLEKCDDLFGNGIGVLELQIAHTTQIDVLDNLLLETAAKQLVALAADAENLDLFAFAQKRVRLVAGQADNGGIERAAQAALPGADDQKMHLVAAGTGKKFRRRFDVGDRGGDVAEHPVH